MDEFSVVLPIEMWGEISQHDYDVWVAIRSLGRKFYNGINVAHIKGRFDYICAPKSNIMRDCMITVFRRLIIGDEAKKEVCVYHGDITAYKKYSYSADVDVYNIISITRNKVVNGHKLSEYINVDKGDISICSRHIDDDVTDKRFESFIVKHARYTRSDTQYSIISVPRGAHAPFVFNDAFYLYNPKAK